MVHRNLEERKVLKEKIYKAIEQAEEPLSVDAVKTRVGATSWHQVQSLLFDLMVEGRIAGMRTSKKWVFGKPEVMKVVKLSEEVRAR